MTCFVCPHGQGPMCSGGCGLCEVCEGEREEEETDERRDTETLG